MSTACPIRPAIAGKLRSRLEALTAQRPASAPRERALHRRREDPAARRDPAHGLVLRRHQRLRLHERCQRRAARRARRSGARRALGIGQRPQRRFRGRGICGAARDHRAQFLGAARSLRRRASIGSRDVEGTELTRAALRRALIELLAHFPIYRTYATADERPARDRRFLDAAVGRCQRDLPSGRPRGRRSDWRHGSASVRAIRKRRTSRIAPSRNSSSSARRSPPRRSRTRRSTAMDVCSRATMSASRPTCSASSAAAFPRARAAPAGRFPARDARNRDARPQARRRRARAARGAEREGRRMGERVAGLDRAMPPAAAPMRATRCFRMAAISRCCCRRSSAHGRSISTWTIRKARRAFAERLARWQEKALREAKLATDWSRAERGL